MRPVCLKRAEVAFVDPAAAMQDHDAIRISIFERLRPGELAAMQIRECERIDRRRKVQRYNTEIARNAVGAPNGRGWRQLTHVRQRPTYLRKLEEAVILEADLFCRRRRRALHPPQGNRVRRIGIGIFDAVDLEYSTLHDSPRRM